MKEILDLEKNAIRIGKLNAMLEIVDYLSEIEENLNTSSNLELIQKSHQKIQEKLQQMMITREK